MSDDSGSNDRSDKSKNELAQQRTDYAEDRTVLANERTFAGWFRTGFASVAIGLGFQALFVRMEPWWVPRAIATIFLLLGVILFFAAERRACQVLGRLSTHQVKKFSKVNFRLVAWLASAGVLALTAAMWFLPIYSR